MEHRDSISRSASCEPANIRLLAGLVVVYAITVSLIPIYAKKIFDGHLGVKKFPYPLAAAGIQLGTAGLLLGVGHTCWHLASAPGLSWLGGPGLKAKLRCAAPPGVAFGCKYAITNFALSLVSNSVHVLLGATDILWVVSLAFLLNGERPGVVQLGGAALCLLGAMMVALQSSKSIEAPFWPLVANFAAPLVGALCISTLRTGVCKLADAGLHGTSGKVEFTAIKLSVAAAAAMFSAMLLENGLGAATKPSWWSALHEYPSYGLFLLCSSGLLTVVFHVNLAFLAHLTSATAIGILGEVKVIPQWLLNAAFSLKVDVHAMGMFGALFGLMGSAVYAWGAYLHERAEGEGRASEIQVSRTWLERADRSSTTEQSRSSSTA